LSQSEFQSTETECISFYKVVVRCPFAAWVSP
jgi:hypothetical protein